MMCTQKGVGNTVKDCPLSLEDDTTPDTYLDTSHHTHCNSSGDSERGLKQRTVPCGTSICMPCAKKRRRLDMCYDYDYDYDYDLVFAVSALLSPSID